MDKTWFITGASRGLGLQIARSALRSGERVVATGRKPADIHENLGPDSDRLLALELDVGNAGQAQFAVDAAIQRFGAIDVLVNNAGYGHVGLFEELAMQDAQAQFATNLFGALNVTWAALPTMRAARKGRIFNVSSLAGLMGAEMYSLYCASKFALEGFSESLSREIRPFGIFVTIVEPGPFRTDFLATESLHFSGTPLADYDDRRPRLRASFEQRNGRQPGDPAKLADAIVHLAGVDKPPMRFAAGAIAVNAAAAKLDGMRAELEYWRQLSVSTDYEVAP